MDSWREQWLNHKKTVSERELKLTVKKEITGDKEGGTKDKKKLHLKDGMSKAGQLIKKESSSWLSAEDNKNEIDAETTDVERNLVSEEGDEKNQSVESKELIVKVEEEKNVSKNVQGENFSAQTAVGFKPGKKKIIKRIVKKKVENKKNSTENATNKNDELKKGETEGNKVLSEEVGQQEGLSAEAPAIKTFARKKILKKPAKSTGKQDSSKTIEGNTTNESGSTQDKTTVKSEDNTCTVVQEGSTKVTVKRKVIKRVPKRKTASADTGSIVATKDMEEIKIIQPDDNKEAVNSEIKESISKDKSSPKMKQQSVSPKKQEKKEEKKADKKQLSGSKIDTDIAEQNVSQSDNQTKSNEKAKPKDKKIGKDCLEKDESKNKDVVKEKKKSDDPPRHPGLFLQTKGSKDSKLQSLSLSLDSLLDYSGNDTEESTFELSLFAESLYEMLQYEMGCRLLAFLQKLRTRFVAKRNQGKRPREQTSKEKNEDNSSSKRVKTEDVEATKAENNDNTHKDNVTEEANITNEVAEDKVEDENEEQEPEEEDPEEEPEEDEEMTDATPHLNSSKENRQQETTTKASKTDINMDVSNKGKVAEEASKTNKVDKELLQAFRFFDRNRTGHIRVEDLRLIIHNLGKFLSHRDVKELVQSALLESDSSRDDRILYDKLVKMTDI
ncbi:uncharacterized protein [Primulina eburnea]